MLMRGRPAAWFPVATLADLGTGWGQAPRPVSSRQLKRLRKSEAYGHDREDDGEGT
jgi:hypothetical protein